MRVTYKNRVVKIVPSIYNKIENITDYLEDFDHLRLSKTERNCLNVALFQNQSTWMPEVLPLNKPETIDMVKGAMPTTCFCVQTVDNQQYFVVDFDNGSKLRCSNFLFKISHKKESLKQAEAYALNFPKPRLEQLCLFE